VSHILVNAVNKQVSCDDPLGARHLVQAQVVNPIVPHRANGSAAGAGW
jgi:hypothetical protein